MQHVAPCMIPYFVACNNVASCIALRAGHPVKSMQCCISNMRHLRRGFESDMAYTALTRTVLGGNWNCPPTRATTAASILSQRTV